MQVDRPEEGDPVKYQKGFYYEIGKNRYFTADDLPSIPDLIEDFQLAGDNNTYIDTVAVILLRLSLCAFAHIILNRTGRTY